MTSTFNFVFECPAIAPMSPSGFKYLPSSFEGIFCSSYRRSFLLKRIPAMLLNSFGSLFYAWNCVRGCDSLLFIHLQVKMNFDLENQRTVSLLCLEFHHWCSMYLYYVPCLSSVFFFGSSPLRLDFGGFSRLRIDDRDSQRMARGKVNVGCRADKDLPSTSEEALSRADATRVITSLRPTKESRADALWKKVSFPLNVRVSFPSLGPHYVDCTDGNQGGMNSIYLLEIHLSEGLNSIYLLEIHLSEGLKFPLQPPPPPS